MPIVTSNAAPIERVTIPLRPRTPAGCCDLAVMYYGRHLLPALRLLLAIAGPAVAWIYGLSRFVGTDFTIAIVALLLVSKALGVLTVAAVARTTFGEPFEHPFPPRWVRHSRLDRLREFTRNLLTAVAWLAGAALFVAALDEAYGTGRLSAMEPWQSAAVVTGLSAVLLVRSVMFISERHAPGRHVMRAMYRGLLLRGLTAAPLVLLLFDETWIVGIVLAIFWLPAYAAAVLWFSYGAERRALAEIDPSLDMTKDRPTHAWNDMLGPALLVAVSAVGLFVMCMAAIEYGLYAVGMEGPLLGPISDYLNPEFFDPALAVTLVGRNPLFVATFVGATLFAYQLARVAWFFTFIDARVRRDCWDLELILAREAKRLEGE